MKKLRMAVVGTGALGRHHARILSQMAGIELAGVVDANPEAARRVAESCGAPAVCDHRELLGRVDAVVVAVPTLVHRPVAGDFLQAGVDVLVEKPIALNVAEAAELVELARRSGALLAVGHVERFNPALQAARPYLTEVKYLRVERLAPFSFRSTDIGVVHDLMIHDIDLALDLVRVPVARVEAFGVPILTDHEDAAQARLTFANGSVADLSANRVSPVVSRKIQAWTTSGSVHIDLGSRETTCYSPSAKLLYGARPLEKAREPGADIEQLKQQIFGEYIEVQKPTVVANDQLTEELASFAESVRARREPLVSGTAALEAMKAAGRVLECIDAASGTTLHNAARRAG